jgi:hypothetical protein
MNQLMGWGTSAELSPAEEEGMYGVVNLMW